MQTGTNEPDSNSKSKRAAIAEHTSTKCSKAEKQRRRIVAEEDGEAEMCFTDTNDGSSFPVEEIVQFPFPGYVAPSSISFSPDDRLITYLFSPEGTLYRKVFSFDLTAKRQELVFSPPDGGGLNESNLSAEEKLRRERSGREGLA
ncbi:hypothetical protein HPP92_002923 [Vanilla planifolia]|uniref:Uncharacterized protein n=1 Tax=Vanilla planifolia TaxID=51239 RepID=A0A835VGR1_VANPL|nr:hypothetical protein HPP92_002923 [Vanilla planifolia]